jgi:acetolactate synthase-1/2/3 large subunit
MTVAEYLADYLERLGVGHVFGVGGANIEDVYDALYRTQGAVKGILAKHEFSAGTMADGYSRTGQGLGVVVTTSGGGAMNVLPALAEAYASCVPVLAIIGQPPTTLEGRGAFQDSSGHAGSIDATALFANLTTYCRRVDDAESFPCHLHDAVAAATGTRPGPAVLLLPKDVQQARVNRQHPDDGGLPARVVQEGDDVAVQRAVRLLGAASAPLIIAGDGVARHDARAELAALCDALGAEVAVTPDARDVFDNWRPAFLGITGVMGHPSVAAALERADTVVCAGTRMPHLARLGLEDTLRRKALISIHYEETFLDAPTRPFVSIEGNIREILQGLVPRLELRQGRPYGRETRAGILEPSLLPGSLGQAPSFREILAAVADELPEDANVFVDAGNTGASATHYLKCPRKGRYVLALGMGGMGYTFGAAIGAAFGSGKPTYVLAGDGAFFMHGLEIHTAIEHDLPITFLIFNNNSHGMCFTREQLYYRGEYSYNLFRRSDIGAGIAAMFPSMRATASRSLEELCRGLRESHRTRGPSLLCIDVDAREVPPFVPFLQAVAASKGFQDEDRRKKAG